MNSWEIWSHENFPHISQKGATTTRVSIDFARNWWTNNGTSCVHISLANSNNCMASWESKSNMIVVRFLQTNKMEHNFAYFNNKVISKAWNELCDKAMATNVKKISKWALTLSLLWTNKKYGMSLTATIASQSMHNATKHP